MKNLNKILIIALAAAGVSSCADLDTQYYGGYVTDDQKVNAVESNPDLAQAAVSACFTQFGAIIGQYSGNSEENQYDFGYPALMIGLDQQTADVAAPNTGYNWFSNWSAYSNPNQNGLPAGMTWFNMYKQIKTANSLIATISPDTDNPELQFSLAQGLAVRAYDYWVLAQLYQFNYKGNENKPCVPIITDENEVAAASEGAPRATVQAVYDQILSDINAAIDLIKESGLTAAQVAQGNPKQLVSLAAAYGIRARVYLTMHNYTEAAKDAQNAITAFSGRPYTAAEISVPGFTNANDNSWMWAICLTSTDGPITSGLVNFGAQFGSLCFGYPTQGDAWRWCNKKLYESIPASDARKGWWLDVNYSSDHLSAQQQAYLERYIPTETDKDGNETVIIPTITAAGVGLRPYTQVKYGTFNAPLGQYVGAFDLPLMRVEEMYLTLAEATGMSESVAAGKAILDSFVQTFRDPEYSCDAADQASFQDEVWRQRRIELWGEGLAYFDVMRLNKGVDRAGGYFPNGYDYNIPAGDPVLIYCIPQSELTANPQINPADNNPTSSRPTPINEKFEDYDFNN